LRFSLYLCAKSKSRKKRDHGETQAVLFAHQNKFPALPKSHNFHFEEGDDSEGDALLFARLAKGKAALRAAFQVG
jgi:hypothetical protein